jgi:hypothetical protein
MNHNYLSFTMGSSLLILAAAFSSGVSALTITPMKGQTPEQIQRDRADCTAVAQQGAAPSQAFDQAFSPCLMGKGYSVQ